MFFDDDALRFAVLAFESTRTAWVHGVPRLQQGRLEALEWLQRSLGALCAPVHQGQASECHLFAIFFAWRSVEVLDGVDKVLMNRLNDANQYSPSSHSQLGKYENAFLDVLYYLFGQASHNDGKIRLRYLWSHTLSISMRCR